MAAIKKLASDACWQREFAVGDRYRCTVSVNTAPYGQPSAVRVAWEPHPPSGLSDFEVSEYIRGRDKALAEFASESGYGVAVLTI
jgi:hypothetical protein